MVDRGLDGEPFLARQAGPALTASLPPRSDNFSPFRTLFPDAKERHPMSRLPTDDHDNLPEIGVGSAVWLRLRRQDQVAASALGSFVGEFFGRVLRPGPTYAWDTRGHLRVETASGITITLDPVSVAGLSHAIARRTQWYCPGTSDLDLSTSRADPAQAGPTPPTGSEP